MLKILHILHVFIFIIFLIFTKQCIAFDGFNDNFTNKEENKWIYINNGGSITYDNNLISIGSTGYYFPLVISRTQGVFPAEEDAVLSIRFRYLTSGFMGDGIGVGFTGSNNKLFTEFGIWRDSLNGSFFYYNNFNTLNQGFCSDFSNTRDLLGRQYKNINLNDNSWHLLKIEKKSNIFYVYIDPEFNTDPIYITSLNQCIPNVIWFGNPSSGGSGDWNSLDIDYVKVSNIDDGNLKPKKIIILPGLGASWNSKAMIYGEGISSGEWKMTPFVKNYDGLIDALGRNGLKKDEDFYVWNYDWRKPINNIVDDFNSFVASKIGSDDEIVLIGHSLGGLVARIWAQDYKSDRSVDIYNLGSPNYGSLKAYEAWNGGKLSQGPDISSIAVNLLLEINRKNEAPNLTSFRNYVPVLKDLLPTFDFVKKNRTTIPVNDLESKNLYLSQKNNELVEKDLNLKSYVGVGQKTNEWINLEDRSVFDKTIGIWPDGKPVSYSDGDGDKTVLKKSALLIGSSAVEINANHSSLVDKSLNDILSKLNLETEVNNTVDDFSNSMVFLMGSPADMSVKCDNDQLVDDQDGLIIIKNNNYKSCNLTLNGTGDGVYHLIAGNTNNVDRWQYFENKIKSGENYSLRFNPNSGEMSVDNSNLEFLNKSIEEDVKSLLDKYKNNIYLNNSLKALKNKNILFLTENIFKFREKSKEDNVTNEIINNSQILLEIYNRKYSNLLAKLDHLQALENKILVERMSRINKKNPLKLSVFSANSYIKAKNLIDQSAIDLKNNQNSAVLAKTFVAKNYLKEVR